MTYTDTNIPIHCGECKHQTEGVDDMMAHILDAHADYDATEAVKFARLWADDAYEQMARWEQDHAA